MLLGQRELAKFFGGRFSGSRHGSFTMQLNFRRGEINSSIYYKCAGFNCLGHVILFCCGTSDGQTGHLKQSCGKSPMVPFTTGEQHRVHTESLMLTFPLCSSVYKVLPQLKKIYIKIYI